MCVIIYVLFTVWEVPIGKRFARDLGNWLRVIYETQGKYFSVRTNQKR